MKNSGVKKKPNLLIIGAQKAATTWLHNALQGHPDVFMADGEQQYFNRDSSSFDDYLKNFSDSGEYRILGEKTPDYLHMSTKRIQRTKCLLDSVKIVAILRRPEDRAWSQARMEESLFNQTELGKSDHCRLARNVISLRNRDRCNYASHLKRWKQVFGDQAIMVGFYEDIVENPAEFIERLFRWLGVDPSLATSLPPRIWQSPANDVPSDVAAYLASIHGSESARLRSIGITVPESWDSTYGHQETAFPLLRDRMLMLVPNAIYRVFDRVRGQVSGRYTTIANRWFHRYISSHRRVRRSAS